MDLVMLKRAVEAMEAQGPDLPGWARSPEDVMLTVAELAARMKTTVRTIEEWRKNGVLEEIQVGTVLRFYWPEVVWGLLLRRRVAEEQSGKGNQETEAKSEAQAVSTPQTDSLSSVKAEREKVTGRMGRRGQA